MGKVNELFFKVDLDDTEKQLASSLNPEQVQFSIQKILAGRSIDFEFRTMHLLNGYSFDFSSPAQRLEMEEKIKDACSRLKNSFDAVMRGAGEGSEVIKF